jgi:ferric-dicitrate binding protein FerR (iron transport regulator)
MDTNKEKIRRFTSGKFSFNDYLSVSSLFKSEENNEGLKESMEMEWNETDHSSSNKERLSQILDNLHLQINRNSKDKVNVFRNFYNAFSKVAVVLIIPALITIAVLSYLTINSPERTESWAEIHSPVGSRTKFQLPDGTQGWLNSGSSIKYPVNFMSHRNVEISGEAWLDVVHIESKDFRVITPFFDVKVVGTQFNVIAYDDESTAEVILERGKILVLGKDEELKGELNPDQQLVFNKSANEFIKTRIDSKSYNSWKDGILIFRNVPMAEIAKRLERKYNTEIILHGDSLKSSIFRATFQDESLDEICKMLSTVAPIKYKIHDRKKQADNTFAKGKVEMWFKNNINLK